MGNSDSDQLRFFQNFNVYVLTPWPMGDSRFGFAVFDVKTKALWIYKELGCDGLSVSQLINVFITLHFLI